MRGITGAGARRIKRKREREMEGERECVCATHPLRYVRVSSHIRGGCKFRNVCPQRSEVDVV